MSTHDAGLMGLTRANRKALQANIANYYLSLSNMAHDARCAATARFFVVDKTYVRAAVRNFDCSIARMPRKVNKRRQKLLIKAKREGWPLTKVGEKLGVTRERARQLLNRLHEVETVDPRVTHAEAMARLFPKEYPCKLKILHRIMEKYGTQELHESDLAKLTPLVKAETKPKRCEYCKKEMPATRVRWCTTWCGYKFNYTNGGGTAHLEAIIKKMRKRATGKWVPISVGSRSCGLTIAQIAYYQRKDVFRTRKSTHRFWRGQPTLLYALNDLRAFAKFLKSKS